MHSPLIIAGTSHPDLAASIAKHAQWPLARCEIKRFACSEVYVRLLDNVRGRDVVVVQSPHQQIDAQIWELMAIVDAARFAGARHITALMPCLPYARQDKTGSSRESLTPRMLAAALEAVGVSDVLTMDLHTGQLQGFFRIPCHHVTAQELLTQTLKAHGMGGDQWVVVAPDSGRVKLARRFATGLDCPLVVMSKHRPAHGEAYVTKVEGGEQLAGRSAIIIDDIIDTAGTLCAAADVIAEAGAVAIHAAATHALLSGPAIERLQSSAFTGVWVTDSVPVSESAVLDAALHVTATGELWAKVLRAVANGDSLSGIFGGHNQEF